MNKFEFNSIGSHFEISIYDNIDDIFFSKIKNEIVEKTNLFNDKYSRFNESSIIYFLKNKTGIFSIPEELINILNFYFKIYKLSNKKFTPLIGSILNDLGYDEKYSLIPKEKIRDINDLYESIKIIDNKKIEIIKPIELDIGGIGKGYCVDSIKEILEKNNIKKFIVNGGGDIFYKTNDDEFIVSGLENPNNLSQIIGTINIKNKSICASSGSRRKWNNYHHIIDPSIKKQNEEIIATWVIAENTKIADTIATSLFMCPPESFFNDFEFEYCILNKDMKIKKSKNFNANFY